jgi:CYTH domain-containing protein
METELGDKDEYVDIPAFIKILYEVTGEKRYSNAKMAESFPPEPISD